MFLKSNSFIFLLSFDITKPFKGRNSFENIYQCFCKYSKAVSNPNKIYYWKVFDILHNSLRLSIESSLYLLNNKKLMKFFNLT